MKIEFAVEIKLRRALNNVKQEYTKTKLWVHIHNKKKGAYC